MDVRGGNISFGSLGGQKILIIKEEREGMVGREQLEQRHQKCDQRECNWWIPNLVSLEDHSLGCGWSWRRGRADGDN